MPKPTRFSFPPGLFTSCNKLTPPHRHFGQDVPDAHAAKCAEILYDIFRRKRCNHTPSAAHSDPAKTRCFRSMNLPSSLALIFKPG